MTAGTVLTTVGGIYTVELPSGEIIEAVLRGRLKREERADERVVTGDDVLLACQDGRWIIEAAQPRRSQLARRAPGPGRPRPKVIAANIDRVIIVFAAAHPEPNARMLDRFLVLAEANHIEPLIVLNKADLLPAPPGLSPGDVPAPPFLAPYRAAGYRTLLTSARTRQGIEELREVLCANVAGPRAPGSADSAGSGCHASRAGRSVLTGPSGVGKSSLLNAIQPGLGLRIGEVSEAVRKGRHTTVAARLIRLECGGYVADTPGLREVGLWGIESEQLASYFPEFRPLLDECRFGSSCTHTHEPGCAVRAAVEAGQIPAARYESYLALRAE